MLAVGGTKIVLVTIHLDLAQIGDEGGLTDFRKTSSTISLRVSPKVPTSSMSALWRLMPQPALMEGVQPERLGCQQEETGGNRG